jgi:hypothetical protein
MRTLTPDIVTGPMSTSEVAAPCVPRVPSDTYETGSLLDVPGTFDFTFHACKLAFYPQYGADNL